MKRLVAFVPLLLAACGGAEAQRPPLVANPPGPVAVPSVKTEPPDALGPRPIPPPSAPFTPATPVELAGPGGSKIWLFERHSLPLVSIAVAVPYGSASEPHEDTGLAFVAADMLDEGAGKRDAIALSGAIDALGAKLSASADRDASVVSMHVLASRLEEALPLFADVVLRPRDEKRDFARVVSLWTNALKARSKEPNDVARVVTSAAYYGLDHPYGPPPEGTLAAAKRITLAKVTRWQRTVWRPDRAVFVVAGDVTKEQATALLGKAFADWKAPKGAAPEVVVPKPPEKRPLRTVVVDRKDAPQVVLSVAAPGVAASDPSYALLSLANVALGGSFTSRLNQDLREDHGYTYGARSRFNFQRGAGMFVARAAIRTDAIGDALGAMLADVRKMGKDGLADAELEKVKTQVQSDAVEAYSTLHGVTGSLASNASAALGPDADAKTLAAQRDATQAEVRPLLAKYLGLEGALVVLVGPREAALKALEQNGLPAPEIRDAEGNVVAEGSAAPKAAQPSAKGTK